MRIISIVSLVTPDGAYGGPLRVAVNQASALAKLGHDVVLAAGARGYQSLPTEVDGVPARLFPAFDVLPGAGFAGITSPGLLRWLRGAMANTDVVHVHASRDLLTLPAAAIARRAKVPYLVQPHGMIDPSSNPLAIPLDAIWTKPLLRSAAGVLHLTDLERDQLREVAGNLRFLPLSNGVPSAEPGAKASADPEVLFLARLAPRKRPLVFAEAARLVAPDFPKARFTLVGPDEGEVPALKVVIEKAAAEGVRITWEGALAPDRTLDRMRSADIYALPSVDEPYGMTVVEALSVGKPVVITDTCGLAGFVRKHDAGIVTDNTVGELAKALTELLSNPADAAARGARGRAAVKAEFSMEAIAQKLADYYSEAVCGAPTTGR